MTGTNGAANTAVRPRRFADGSAVRLQLSGGDWVLVRKELSYGQQRRLATAGLTGVPAALAADGAGPGLSVDWARYEVERVVTWVLDWSFRDSDGDAVVVSREAIENLHPDTAAELNRALDAHVAAQEGKARPSSPAGAPARSSSAATSPSAGPSAGPGAT